MKPLELIETKEGRAICETTPRYNVMHYGRKVGQLYFNMRGYCNSGRMPTPDGCNFDLGEAPISKWRSLVVRLNAEWKQHDREAAAIMDPTPDDTPSLEDRGLSLGSYTS